MKRALFIFILAAVILSLLPSLWSCQKEDIGNPQEAIIGKWEKIAEGPDEDRIVPIETDGSYREFLPNGEHKGYWHSEYTYQIDSVFLYLYCVGIPINDFIYEYAFINRSTLKLTYVRGNIPNRADYPIICIYQRIK
jgi:hypothetical protein